MKSEKIRHLLDNTVVRFIIVGVANTLIGWIAMFLTLGILKLCDADHFITYWGPSAVNIIVGSIVSYILNKNFTFQSNTEVKKDIVKFTINIIICYLVAYKVASPICETIFKHSSESILTVISLLSGSVLFTILNYFGQRFWVFKKQNTKE